MKFIRDVILTSLAVLMVALALEGLLRLARERYMASFYAPEVERGYSMRPYAEGWYTTAWSQTYLRFNSDGMRGPERPVRRPPNAFRVAVVGSSDVLAPEVPLEQTVEAELERQLAPGLGRRGIRVEALNFGVIGYTQSQQYLTLHNDVWKYDPQLVVQILNKDRLIENTRETFPGADTTPAPLYELRGVVLELAEPTEAMSLALSTTQGQMARKRQLSEWMNGSYLLSMLNQFQLRLKDRTADVRRRVSSRSGSAAATPILSPDSMERWSYQPYAPEIQHDWEIGEAFLRAMKAECDRHGAEYWVVIADTPAQTRPGLAARAAFMRRLGLPSLTESEQRVERFCEENGIHALALAPPMGAYAETHGVFLRGEPWTSNQPCLAAGVTCHWNQLGNRVAGRVIGADLLRNSDLIKTWSGERR